MSWKGLINTRGWQLWNSCLCWWIPTTLCDHLTFRLSNDESDIPQMSKINLFSDKTETNPSSNIFFWTPVSHSANSTLRSLYQTLMPRPIKQGHETYETRDRKIWYSTSFYLPFQCLFSYVYALSYVCLLFSILYVYRLARNSHSQYSLSK